MSGPEDIARTIAAAVRDGLPARLAALEAELALGANAIPPPRLVAEQERDLLALAEWPAIFTVVQNLTGLDHVDGPNDDGTVTYQARYPVRLFVFVRVLAGTTNPYEEVDLLRKRYVRALRELILGAQEATAVDVTTYAESYSDVGVDDDNRHIAGAWVQFDALVDERVVNTTVTYAPDPDGWAIDVELDVLPHPALE